MAIQASVPRGFMPGTGEGGTGINWLEICGFQIDLNQIDVVLEADGSIHAPAPVSAPNQHTPDNNAEYCDFSLFCLADALTILVQVKEFERLLPFSELSLLTSALLSRQYSAAIPRAPPFFI